MTSYECMCPICEKIHTMKAKFAPGTMTVIMKDDKEYVRMSCGNHSSREVTNGN